MSDFVFELARPEDDEALRQLVASEPVPGAITVRYSREPSYFAGCGVMGVSWQVLVCRHQETGAVAGVACRALRQAFVNGEATQVGYLGQLRVASAFRGRALLRQGFGALRPVMEDGAVRGHVTTIIEENRGAMGLLVDHVRHGLPRYREVARLETLVLAARGGQPSAPTGCTLEAGSPSRLGEVLAFLNLQGALRQFAPCLHAAEFAPGSPSTLGFRLEDLLVARRDGGIVGALGLWDQSAFKQSIVSGYEGALARWRPALNLAAPLVGRPRLPAPGTRLRYAYACFAAAERDDEAVFAWLLRLVLARARDRGFDYVLLGLDGRDPLAAVARRLRPVVYASRVYTVAWDDDALHASLDGRPTGLEAATL